MALSKYLVKKPVHTIQQESQSGELKRSLSATNLFSLVFGCIIGTGIFVMTGQAAALYAGPAIIISFLLTGLCCAFCAMCYAELASILARRFDKEQILYDKYRLAEFARADADETTLGLYMAGGTRA